LPRRRQSGQSVRPANLVTPRRSGEPEPHASSIDSILVV
jgi:hypothetical protein